LALACNAVSYWVVDMTCEAVAAVLQCDMIHTWPRWPEFPNENWRYFCSACFQYIIEITSV